MADTIEQHPDLIELSDSVLTVANPEEDVRGRKVIDVDGTEIGHVDDLLLDAEEVKVRFLKVKHGGLLGIGAETILVPIDAITRIHDDHVHIDQSSAHVAGTPAYHPELADKRYWDNVYAHYNFRPFYGKGYNYPGYPFYP